MMRTNDRDAANEIDEAMRLWPRRRRPRVEDEDRGIVRLRGGGRIEGTVARRDRKAIVVQTSQGTVVVIATAEDR